MTLLTLVRHNIAHFWKTNLAVVAGVAVAVAVLAGALLVGSSVRASLRGLALERLGDVDQVVTSAAFVREELAAELLARDGMQDAFAGAVPMVAVEGFVTHQESGRRASAIQVYGVDDRFWAFHGHAGGIETPGRNEVLVSEGLANELAAELDQALLVRVEKPSDVPISSLHGRRDDIGRTLRLRIARVLPPDALGEFSFRPQQGRARSVFVSLTRLQRELEQPGRVNTILLRGADGPAAAEGWELPELVIVDGGKGQLSAALAAMRAAGAPALPIIGLAKEQEEIFRPDQAESLVLPRTSQALYLIQRIRDEAHRFAITYHRSVRRRRTIVSALDRVPGIGPKRKRALLRQFGSVPRVREASDADLLAVSGMTKRAVAALREHL